MPSYAYVMIIAALFGAIALGVFLLRKYVPALQNHDEVKQDEKDIAEENVSSKLMTSEEEHPLDHLDDDDDE